MRDYYKILGILPSAHQHEVRKAFREKAKCLHPDVNPDCDTQEEFKILNEAYQVLSNRYKRNIYDLRRRNGVAYQKVYYRPGNVKYRARGERYAHYKKESDAKPGMDKFEKFFDFLLFITLLFAGCYSLLYGVYRLWFVPENEINPYPGILMGAFFTALMVFIWKHKKDIFG